RYVVYIIVSLLGIKGPDKLFTICMRPPVHCVGSAKAVKSGRVVLILHVKLYLAINDGLHNRHAGPKIASRQAEMESKSLVVWHAVIVWISLVVQRVERGIGRHVGLEPTEERAGWRLRWGGHDRDHDGGRCRNLTESI